MPDSRSHPHWLRCTWRLVFPSLVAGLIFVSVQDSQSQVGSVKTVFVIMMSGRSWSSLKGGSNSTYINSLLPVAAYTSTYFSVPGGHPMEADYFQLEAGSDLGVALDASPAVNHQSTTKHLVSLLDGVGISWKTYQEGIVGNGCPITDGGSYITKSNPFVFFDDVTNNLSSQSLGCIAHVRPYTELAADLSANNVARYNFIRPNLCDSMLRCDAGLDSVSQGDKWLSQEVPKIVTSSVYKDGGALFIIWDHGDVGNDGPVGMILLSPFAKKGYTNKVRYTHASTLRTVQEIFGLTPLLGDAANQSSLEDLFLTQGTDNLSATVTWTASPGASTYKVKRGVSADGPFETIATGIVSTSYADRSISPGATYFYLVSAVNGSGESPPSSPISLTTTGSVPPMPTNVSVKQGP